MKTFQEIQPLLKAALAPERIYQRDGGRGRTLSYIKGHDAINTMNLIFDEDGWETDNDIPIMDAQIPYQNSKGQEKTSVFYKCRVSVTFHMLDHEGSVYSRTHTDVGIGISSDLDPQSMETAIKDSVTDGLKRCLRKLGNQFGNSLYDTENSPALDFQRRSSGPPKRPPARPAPTQEVPF